MHNLRETSAVRHVLAALMFFAIVLVVITVGVSVTSQQRTGREVVEDDRGIAQDELDTYYSPMFTIAQQNLQLILPFPVSECVAYPSVATESFEFLSLDGTERNSLMMYKALTCTLHYEGDSEFSFQRVTLTIYEPKGQYWQHIGGEGEPPGVVYYDFDDREWFALTELEQKDGPDDIVRMEPGFFDETHYYRPMRPQVDTELRTRDVVGYVFRKDRGLFSTGGAFVIYQDPVYIGMTIVDDNTCLTLDVSPLCSDFWNPNLLERFANDEVLAQIGIERL